MARNHVLAIGCAACLALGPSAAPGQSAITKDEVDAAKNAIDLAVYQSLSDLLVRQREAEARRAIAEAERAELLARLPATEIRALAGSVNVDKFGAAGLVKAFDLAKELAGQLCASTESLGTLAVYDAAAVQGVVGARIVDRELASITKQLGAAQASLDEELGRKSPAVLQLAPALAIGMATTAIKSAGDLASLFRTNAAAASAGFGEAARGLFTTSLAEQCPGRIAGLGAGYLGELDSARYEELRNRLASLIGARREFADRVAAVKKLADAEKTEPRKSDLNALVAVSGQMLKTVDAFVESVKPFDVSDRSPLYNAARYLSYAARTANSRLLDFDLRLEGLTLTRENIFLGQRLRLSGVAFLTYRVYEADGTLLKAEALRRITPPVEVDLRGNDVDGEFWNGPGQPARK